MSGSLVTGFKKAFKIKEFSNDWAKWNQTLTRNLAELKKWTDLYVELQPGQQQQTVGEVGQLQGAVTHARATLQQNAAAGGPMIRDNCIPAVTTMTAKYRKLAKESPAKAQIGGKNVDVFLTDLPGFEDMPKAQRDAVRDAAAQKTADGLALYDRICNPQPGAPALPKPTPKDVTNLVWAIKSKAQAKNGPYTKGALTVPGGPALRTYLDGCESEVYRRDSSHMLEQQGKGKDMKPHERPGPGQTPRGMDFYDAAGGMGGNPPDLDRLLPAGMNALLYQEITSPNGQKTLYLKMETEGAYLSGGKNAALDATAQGLTTRPMRRSDISHSIAHGANLVKSKIGISQGGADHALGSTREKTPAAIKAVCKRITKEATDKDARKTLAAAFGTELAWGGLKKQRYPRINTFLSTLDALEKGGKLNPELDPLMTELFSLIDDEFGLMSAEEEDRRMGEEVVLMASDMA